MQLLKIYFVGTSQLPSRYLLISDLEYESASLRNWARHKQNKFIMHGLNKNLTHTNPALFAALRKNDNAVEQSHYKANARGKQLSLVAAILR